MAWTYKQKFDDLNNGDLDGQDNWSGSTDIDVSETSPCQGTKSVRTNTEGAYIERSIDAVANGILYVTMKSDAPSDSSVEFYLKDGGNDIACVTLHTDQTISFYITSGWQRYVIQDYTPGDCYRIGIEFNATTDKYRVNVNGGEWTDWKDTIASFDTINTIRLMLYEAYGPSWGYWDFISPNAEEPAKARSQGHIF